VYCRSISSAAPQPEDQVADEVAVILAGVGQRHLDYPAAGAVPPADRQREVPHVLQVEVRVLRAVRRRVVGGLERDQPGGAGQVKLVGEPADQQVGGHPGAGDPVHHVPAAGRDRAAAVLFLERVDRPQDLDVIPPCAHGSLSRQCP